MVQLLGVLRSICSVLELVPGNGSNASTTTFLMDVADWFNLKYSPPFTVTEVSLSRIEGWKVIKEHLTVFFVSSATTYNILLSNPQRDKYFVVFRSEHRDLASLTFDNIKHKLHLLASASYVLDTEMVQKLLNAINNHPTFGCAHIACLLDLPDLLFNADVAEFVNETTTGSGKTPFHIALEQKKLNCVLKLLQLNARLDLHDSKGNIPLHLAAGCSNSVFLNIIAPKCEHVIDKRNREGETALHEACLKGLPENVDILLKYGASPSLTESDRQPIHCAVIIGNIRCVESLIKNDASLVRAKEKSTGNSLLHLTKIKEMMHLLIKLGCPMDDSNNENQSPLLVRIQEDDFSSTFSLLIWGADALAADGDGMTALHLAIKRDNLQLVKMLIVFGADVNERNSYGFSSLHEAAQSTGQNRNEILHCLQLVGAKTCSQQKCWIKCNVCDDLNVTIKVECPTNTTKSEVREILCETGDRQKKGLRVLCLDAGGMKDLVTIKILMTIERITGRPTRETFDWIGGTGTGAILAMGLLQGKTLNQLMDAYFYLKDNVFQGTKPCDSESFEKFLKNEFGENTKMADVQKPRVMLTAALGNRVPLESLILRNYHIPITKQGSTVPQKTSSQPLFIPEDQLVWEALKATSSAPTNFRASGRFIDGGFVANNPTLDVLSEINKFNNANKAAQKYSEMESLHGLISIGAGRAPPKTMGNRHYTVTTYAEGIVDCPGDIETAKSLKNLAVDKSTHSEEQFVSRAAAWCNMIDVPYYRLNPKLSEDVPLDCTDDSKLINMLWETECYLRNSEETLMQLKNLLK